MTYQHKRKSAEWGCSEPYQTYRIFSIISAVLLFFQHPSTPCLYWRPRLYWRPCLYFFNQYIHTEQEEIHAKYHACSINFYQDRATNRDCAYNVSKGAHSVLVLETVLVMETCAYNREYTITITGAKSITMRRRGTQE